MARVCELCGKPFTNEHPMSRENTYNNKPVNDDCYFEALGEEIEQHPIVNPELIIKHRRHHGDQAP